MSDEDHNGEKRLFYRLITAAESDIGQYEAAKRSANLDEAARILQELRRQVQEARNEWMGIELYFPEPPRVLAWHSVQLSNDLPTAIRTMLKIIKNELAQDSL